MKPKCHQTPSAAVFTDVLVLSLSLSPAASIGNEIAFILWFGIQPGCFSCSRLATVPWRRYSEFMKASLCKWNALGPQGANHNMGDIVEEDLSRTQIQPPGWPHPSDIQSLVFRWSRNIMTAVRPTHFTFPRGSREGVSGVNKKKARGDRNGGKVNEGGMWEALADYCREHDGTWTSRADRFALFCTLQGRRY